ncbi:hypothetical protein [Pygmaiobacter massiliensis]|uniref:hypothetical protein n=1 Tax=Pygmaiobacter massiliensis TaxID=1917873 RepID=UPI00289E421C|nr:hypothetical protein [Pygmaiobacter massiliensis]
MAQIELLKASYDGYEQIIEFRIQNPQQTVMWGHMISHDEYLESGSMQYDSDKNVEASFSIELVMDLKTAIESKSLMAIQEIENSSHIKCVGIVKNMISSDSIMCEVAILGDVIVELEKPNAEIEEGMFVEFTGNLELEFL